MKKKDKELVQTCAGLLVVMVMLLLVYYTPMGIYNEDTITIGVFSDSYWGVQNGYSYRILDDAIAKFEKEHPGIHVEYESGIMKKDYSEWLASSLLQRKAPDVFFVLPEDLNDLVEIGALEELDHIQERDQDFDSGVFFSSAYQYGQYDAKQYALPYECASTLMFVNKTMLEKENIKLPKKTWTWNEFYNICKRCTKDINGDGTIDQFGVYDYTWINAFESNDVQLFDPKGKKCFFTGEKVQKSLEFTEKLNRLNATANVTEKEFDLGNVAFQPMSFSNYRAYQPYPLSIKKYSGFEWGCLPMPAGPSGDNISSLDTLLLSMNRNSKHKELAWDLMKVLTTDPSIQNKIFEYSEGVSVLSKVTKETRTLDSQMSEEVSSAIEKAVVIPKFRKYEEGINEVNKAVNEMMNSSINISTDLIIHNRAINKYLDNEK